MKSSKGKGLLGLLAILLCIGLFGYFGYDTMDDIKLGLDLEGGVSITYQALKDAPTSEEMSDTVYKLQQRVQNYSTEAEVYQEGSNRINIDIPGENDADAILMELGKPGSLLFMDEAGKVILTGDQVASAKAGIMEKNGLRENIVNLTFTPEGREAFAKATEENLGKIIYIIYDNEVKSYPRVNSVISGGECYIEGMEDYETAENLAATIRIGSLSLELEELRSNVVGAKLGQEAISTSLRAAAIGFLIVALFMVFAYRIPGVASVLALCLYVGLELILLSAFEVTLTLPGIAGIILSIGMAVDANVIIFTRIKEEIGVGKTVRSAVKTGFSKALSAIIDGNVTTLIAAVVLFWRGSGTVKGFASTLAIGIILSMFTALFVTKGALYALYAAGFQDVKFYGVKKAAKPKGFLGKKKIFFTASIAMIVLGWAVMGMGAASGRGALNYGMDFKGGTSTNVTFNEDMSLEDISAKVVPVVEKITGDPEVQTQKVAGTNEVIIKTKTLSVEQRQALNEAMAEQFGVDSALITTESISGAVSQEMKQDAVAAVVIATICMLIYIWFRFKDIRFAASAVLALVHDVLVVLTCYAVARWSVGSTFIACMLTIVGYSINATIVIFDRIRENMQIKDHKETLEALVNRSITETFTRSINTSLTTFIMVFVLFLLGVSSIREFALPLMAGIIFGGYSSICVTGALWYVLTMKKKAVRTE
ncbi:MAG: protein translocase subunit SecD [Hungatella sp.]|nr:protein translocase subunit SecD [Hungatella sp.]